MIIAQEWLYRAGRAGLASLFLLGALNKILQFETTAERMSGAGLDPAFVLLPLVIGLEAGAGAALAIGSRLASYAALALAVFTLATNAAFHRFWELSGPVAGLELSLFFKNVAIAGALIAVAMAEKQRFRTRTAVPHPQTP